MHTSTHPDIKSLVSGDKQARFVRFRHGQLWYATDCGFEFPVPASDIGDASFMATERAMSLMRYIRKHLAAIAEAQADATHTVAQPALAGLPRC